MPKKSQLKVLEGGRDKQVKINSLTLKTVPDTLSPLPADIRLFEEDTFLILTVDPLMRYREEHTIHLMTKVAEAKPNKPGSIVINNSSWYAIIHDLDSEPTCRNAWVEKAYLQALMLAEIKRVKRMGLPLLGSVHGRIPPEKSLEMLVIAIQSISFAHLKKILVLVPQQHLEHIWQQLKKLSG